MAGAAKPKLREWCQRCGRRTDKRGRTCCMMCWNGYGEGQHSRACRRRTQ